MLGSMENTSGGTCLCLDSQLIICAMALSQKRLNRNVLKCCSEHDCDGLLLQVGSCSSATRCRELWHKIMCSKCPSDLKELPTSWDHTAPEFVEPAGASSIDAVYSAACIISYTSLQCVFPSAAKAFSGDFPRIYGVMKCRTLVLVRKHLIPKRIVFFLVSVRSKQTQNGEAKLRIGLLQKAPEEERQGWSFSSWRAAPGLDSPLRVRAHRGTLPPSAGTQMRSCGYELRLRFR